MTLEESDNGNGAAHYIFFCFSTRSARCCKFRYAGPPFFVLAI